MKKARVLLADDHMIVAEGLKSLLEEHFELLGISEDGKALVRAAEEMKPDIIIADVSMPHLTGIEAARQIKENNREVRIIFLTMYPDVSYAVSAFEAGACGYVLKQGAASELFVAINEALRGRTYVTPAIAGDLMRAYRDMSAQHRGFCLTPRQREVMQFLSEGRSTKKIASLMNISKRTVEYHKYRMMEKLGIKSLADLIRYAIKRGIVTGH